MNSVMVMGNLTKDAELRHTKTGKAVASFTVAVTRKWTSGQGEEKEGTDYIPVVVWGKQAEAAGALRKGARVFVEGRFQTRSYETKEGEKRYMTEVVANLVAPQIETEPAGDWGAFSTMQTQEQRRASYETEQVPF
ncbi:MAG: single-stranded DNA-binding protein [Veillonellaceae bacterium]|nr:single-stranded DNA-binding protein [Veillonellaceae bacterium]